MTNINNEKQITKYDMNCSFYDFANNYIRINDGSVIRTFNETEIKQLEEIQQMMDKGYKPRLVHLRKSSKVLWQLYCN